MIKRENFTGNFLIVFLFIITSTSLLASSPSNGALSLEQKVAHLFNRLAFGARPGDQEKLLAIGSHSVDLWLNEQMDPEKINDINLENKLKELPFVSMDMKALHLRYQRPLQVAKSMGITPENFKKDKEVKKNLRKKIGLENLPEALEEDFVSQKIIRAVESRKQLQEVLLNFWFNHFNIDIRKGQERWMLPSFEKEALRPNLFGNFRKLLGATAHHPAMLFYLDNFLSENGATNRKGLNENYAREIMELHTLGVEGGYTQKDVTELARILTGWGIDKVHKDPTFKFRVGAHDKGEKILLGRKFPSGGVENEGEMALDMLAKHASTAKFISTKLCRYFVSDKPPASLVARVSKVFLESDGDLKKVYLAIFKSPEFWEKSYYRSKIKTPFQFAVSAIRSTGGEVANKSEVSKLIAQMGEPLYRCAPPTGYKDTAETWVNPGALVERLNFSLQLAANRVNGVYLQIPVVKYTTSSKLVDTLTANLLHEKLSKESEKVVLNEFNCDDCLMADGELRPFSYAKAIGLIIGSPEFQRR